MVKKYRDRLPPTQRWIRQWYENLFFVITQLKEKGLTEWIDYYPETGAQRSRSQSDEDIERFYNREGDALVAHLPVILNASGNFLPVLAFVRDFRSKPPSPLYPNSTQRILHLTVMDSISQQIFPAAIIIRTEELYTERPLHHLLINPITGVSLNRGEAIFIKGIFDQSIQLREEVQT